MVRDSRGLVRRVIIEFNLRRRILKGTYMHSAEVSSANFGGAMLDASNVSAPDQPSSVLRDANQRRPHVKGPDFTEAGMLLIASYT